MKNRLIAIVFIIFTLNVYGEWIDVKQLSEMISEEYWDTLLQQKNYDDFFYEMMIREIGINKNERIILIGEISELRPIEVAEGFWGGLFFTLSKSSDFGYTEGEIVIIFSELPVEILNRQGEKIPCVVFARYNGTREFIYQTTYGPEIKSIMPVLIVDQIAVSKQIYDVYSFKSEEDFNYNDIIIDSFKFDRNGQF